MGNLIRWLLLPVISLLITGCDFGLSFGDDGTIRSSSNKDIIRGLAGAYETVRESEGESSARRDLIMREAVKNNANLDGKFIEYLESNPNYSNVKVNGVSKSSGEGMINVSTVSFDVKNEFTVILRFITEEATVIGPLRWHKLPVLSDYEIEVNKTTIPFHIDSAIVMFGIVNKNKDQFSDKFVQIINKSKGVNIAFMNLNQTEEKFKDALKISLDYYDFIWAEFQRNPRYQLSECVKIVKNSNPDWSDDEAEIEAAKECFNEATRLQKCMDKVDARSDFCYLKFSEKLNFNMWRLLYQDKDSANKYLNKKMNEKDRHTGTLLNEKIPSLIVDLGGYIDKCVAAVQNNVEYKNASSDDKVAIELKQKRTCNIEVVRLNQCVIMDGKSIDGCIEEIYFYDESDGQMKDFGTYGFTGGD